MTREERLAAYVDSELSHADTRAFEAELAADPALAAQVDAQRALRESLRAAFDPVLDEPMPLKLLAATRAKPPAAAPVRRAIPAWAAMAACLALGVGAGILIPRQPEGGLAVQDGRLTARGPLALALSDGLAADPGAVRIGVTFRDGAGRYCRTFDSAQDRLSGLACRQDGHWLAEATAAYEPSATTYRQASAQTPAPVLAAMDALIAGDPLDAAAERAARDGDWEP